MSLSTMVLYRLTGLVQVSWINVCNWGCFMQIGKKEDRQMPVHAIFYILIIFIVRYNSINVLRIKLQHQGEVLCHKVRRDKISFSSDMSFMPSCNPNS